MKRDDGRLLLVLLPTIALVYIALNWGVVGRWWGDTGRWLHEVDRMAGGEVLYRDFYWPFPPMAIWILGFVGRLFGTGTAVMFGFCSLVFVAITVQLAQYIRRLPSSDGTPLILLGATTVVLSIPLATVGSSPLSAGTYTPAAPIGFFLLLAALVTALPLRESPNIARSAISAGLAGAAVLTKHDFWIPAGLLVFVIAFVALKQRPRVSLAAIGAFATTVGLGCTVVIGSSGLDAFVTLLGGAGQVQEVSGRGLPSWRRLTEQGIAFSGLGLLTLVCLIAGRALDARKVLPAFGGLALVFFFGVALHVGMSVRLGSTLEAIEVSETARWLSGLGLDGGLALVKPSLRILHDRLLRNPFPLILPLMTLVAVWRYRTKLEKPDFRLLAGLLVFALGARARRLFEGVDWYHMVLELPVYALAMSMFLGERSRKAQVLLLATLLGFGGYMHWETGRGFGSRLGPGNWVETERGMIRVTSGADEHYRLLHEALADTDPDRPLLALGYTGGFNYFLRRPNPTPNSQGFLFSYAPADSVMDQLLRLDTPPLLMDVLIYEFGQMPVPSIDLTRWERPMRPSHFTRFERPLFTRLWDRCAQSDTLFGPRYGTVLVDCRLR